jgi:hypothetical protein
LFLGKELIDFSKFSFCRQISAARPLEIDFEVKGCEGENNVVRFLEHVQLYVTIRYTQRGALKVNITSPHGTVAIVHKTFLTETLHLLGTQTTLLSERDQDTSPDGFKNWSFMSVHNWGENPSGLWTIKIMDTVNTGAVHFVLYLKDVFVRRRAMEKIVVHLKTSVWYCTVQLKRHTT